MAAEQNRGMRRVRSTYGTVLLGVIALAMPAAVVGVLATASPVSAAPFTVSNGNDNGPGSLRAAFASAAASSDASNTITVNPGVGSITVTGGELLYNPANNSTLTIEGNGVTIHQNGTARVVEDDSTGLLTIDAATITGGNESPGGAIETTGDLTITNSTVTGNAATGVGADILHVGTGGTGALTLTGDTVTSNTATAPANANEDGILDAGTADVANSTVSNNTDAAAGSGQAFGTLAVRDATLTDSTVSANHTTASGSGSTGGTLDYSSLTLTNSSVTGNTDAAASGIAGGVFAGGPGPTTLIRSSVTGNTNSSASGAAFGGLDVAAPVLVTNSTISDNIASGASSFGGGIEDGPGHGPDASATSGLPGKHAGVRASQSDTTTLVYATLTGNQAQTGANINSTTQLVAFGSVVALPSGGADCVLSGPTTTSNGWNWSDDTSCGFTNTTLGDHQGPGDPRLGAPANNGGPGPTQLPRAGSPLIDAIPASSCQADGAAGITTDERGLARPDSASPNCDIGAVEVQSTTPTPPGALLITPRFTG